MFNNIWIKDDVTVDHYCNVSEPSHDAVRRHTEKPIRYSCSWRARGKRKVDINACVCSPHTLFFLSQPDLDFLFHWRYFRPVVFQTTCVRKQEKSPDRTQVGSERRDWETNWFGKWFKELSVDSRSCISHTASVRQRLTEVRLKIPTNSHLYIAFIAHSFIYGVAVYHHL